MVILFRFWLVYRFGDELHRNRITYKPEVGNKESLINSIDAEEKGKRTKEEAWPIENNVNK